ncbi:MAG TPA: efflux RND transporter periplasmic adaptor subunit [Bryobacteraceae bacterium]|jgi:multidrug efflux pump subunit AcrA (membrane-fusion protein)
MKALKPIITLLLLGAAFSAGRYYSPAAHAAAKPPERKILYWIDPMHPAYKSDKPGIAPDCGMQLEPVYEDAAPAAASAAPQPPGTIQISPEKQQLIGVKFGTAEYTAVSETLRAVGKIAIDETRVVRVHPKVEGWIDHVNVDFIGAPVKKGDTLLTVYSPEMLASEKEYLLALKAHDVMPDGDALVKASRKRLELWDLSPAQIDQLEQTHEPIQSITVSSPAAGIITARNSFARQRITPETELYAITDLSRVWVMADLFENDLPKIHNGQTAIVKMPYAAGGAFTARVDFLQPQVDPQTRTTKVRLEAANPSMTLRPDMFVDVEFAIGGSRQLTVPVDAVLNAGARQTVFIDRGNGYLEPRTVETGDQIDDRIVITRGLTAGDRIVTSANFLIDSESQLKAAVSGMGATK